MQLISDIEFIREYFTEDSQPTRYRVKKWVESGLLEGVVLGTDVYIDVDCAKNICYLNTCNGPK